MTSSKRPYTVNGRTRLIPRTRRYFVLFGYPRFSADSGQNSDSFIREGDRQHNRAHAREKPGTRPGQSQRKSSDKESASSDSDSSAPPRVLSESITVGSRSSSPNPGNARMTESADRRPGLGNTSAYWDRSTSFYEVRAGVQAPYRDETRTATDGAIHRTASDSLPRSGCIHLRMASQVSTEPCRWVGPRRQIREGGNDREVVVGSGRRTRRVIGLTTFSRPLQLGGSGAHGADFISASAGIPHVWVLNRARPTFRQLIHRENTCTY